MVNIKELAVGMRVTDKWYFEWGYGEITWVGKTRLHVVFGKDKLTYDVAHLEYLDVANISFKDVFDPPKIPPFRL